MLAAIGLLVPLPLEGRLGSAIGDLAHAPLFGGMSIAILLIWQRMRPLEANSPRWPRRQWFFRIAQVGLFVFTGGILVEFAQMLTGRKAALHDVIANGLGILAASMICIALLNRKYDPSRRWLTVGSLAIAVVLIGIAIRRPIAIIRDVIAVQTAYPTINAFESPWDLTRWHFDDSSVELVETNVTEGRRAMRWFIHDAKHPAITLLETVTDWSDAASLELDVTLAPDYPTKATLFVKVIDYGHADYHKDVCRKEFQLTPGQTQHLSISRDEIIHGPDQRELNLSQIKFVSLMCYQPGQNTWIDVDSLRVQRRNP